VSCSLSGAAGTREAGRQGVLLDEVQGRRVDEVMGKLVLAGQPGVTDDWVIGAERDAYARCHQGRELVLSAAAGGAGLDVAGDKGS
jgi:hypothetical protein